MPPSTYQVTCPTCGAIRSVSREQYWQITSPKGRSSGDCKSCSLRKKTYPGRKNPGGVKLHDPLANSLFNTRIYRTWSSMRNRCQNPNNRSYPNYGGRGIFVCDRWASFENFVTDMYPSYAANLTIGRVNNDGPYSKDNCRWETMAEQGLNSRHNRRVTFDGVTLTSGQWATKLGMNRTTLEARLDKGWAVRRALTEPVHPDLRGRTRH